MSPSDLEVLIHFHCCPEPHPRGTAPAVEDAIRRFIGAQVMEPRVGMPPVHPTMPGGGSFQLTDKGRAWLQMILATPMPIVQYVDPRTL